MQPDVSVVYLTKNGGDLLRRSIATVNAQRADFSVEVFALDSGSTDGSVEFMRSAGVRVEQIAPQDFAFGPTRDLAFKLSKGRVIVTLSQDVVPAGEDWLRHMADPILADPMLVTACREAPPPWMTTFYWGRQGDFYFTRENWGFIERYGPVKLSCTALGLAREAWTRTGFAPALMSEDMAIQTRLHKAGYTCTRVPALAYHGHNYTLTSAAKRIVNEGFGMRFAGESYGLGQMLKDYATLHRKALPDLVRGLARGQIKSAAEVAYPFIRPFCVWYGSSRRSSYLR